MFFDTRCCFPEMFYLKICHFPKMFAMRSGAKSDNWDNLNNKIYLLLYGGVDRLSGLPVVLLGRDEE